MAALIAGLGCLSYLMIFTVLPASDFAEYNPFAPILSGVILANLALVIARNRLQGFIALLLFSNDYIVCSKCFGNVFIFYF